MMGPAGTMSGLHVDNSFLPFWMTLLQGRKRFRVISYPTWKKRLKKFMFASGDLVQRIPIFDDDFLENTPEFAGITVWTGDLMPGDTIYLPVAAGHAALNLEAPGMQPAIAVTSNFLDERHYKQIKKLACKAYDKDKTLGRAMKEHHCLRLMGVIEGPIDAQRSKKKQAVDGPEAADGPGAMPFLNNFLSDEFCSKNTRAGQCSELRRVCKERGFSILRPAGPCRLDTPQINFTKMDTSGDGYLSLTEFQTLMAFSIPEPPQFALLRSAVKHEVLAFRKHDADLDGRLSCSEFFSMAAEKMGGSEL